MYSNNLTEPDKEFDSLEMTAEFNRLLSKETIDITGFAQVLGIYCKQYGMSKLARETGLSRESLYKSFSGSRSPDFATILKVLNALKLSLAVTRQDTTLEVADK